MDNIEKIRRAEAYSHIDVYTKHDLFAAGSWLEKPVKTVMELLPLFSDYQEIRCLDLGSGVGRNSIPVARAIEGAGCCVDCVDILPLAIDRLRDYALRYGVEDRIRGIVSAIDDYEIPSTQYDLILAISSLEHVCSKEVMKKKLLQIREGTRERGVVCLIVNSGIIERNLKTGAQLQPQFEVNMDTKELMQILERTFAGWNVIKQCVIHQKYTIPREIETVELESDVVTWVARKTKNFPFGT